MEEHMPYNPASPPWIHSYDSHVPREVPVPDIMLHDVLRISAEKYPSATALTFMDEKINYSRLLDETLRVAKSLESYGIGENSCVAILLPNVPQYVTLAYGTMSIGARACLLNPLWSPVQVEEALSQLKADIIVVQDLLLSRISSKVIEEYRVVVASIDDYGSASFKLKAKLGRLLGKLPRRTRNLIEYRSLVAGEKLRSPYRGDPAKTVAAMLYTGGTTGKPKAVMLSHKNIVANIVFQKTWFNRSEAKDIVLGLLPFFHAYGFGSILGLSLNLAANLVLVPRFEPKRLVDTIIKYRINLIPGAPTVYIMLLKDVPEEKLKRLKGIAEICFSGAAPLPVEVIKKWEKITGCKIIEGYGLTETSPVVAANPIYGKRKFGSIGLPMPSTLLAIADPSEPRLVDGIGEIVVSGPQVMIGYYDMPEENEKVFFECCGRRWFRTGDIGYMDKEGFFYIVDRKKDVIKYKGHSVYPRYIEEVLYKHKCVAEAAVVGVPDLVVGENIKAFIVLKPECRGKVTEKELIEWSKQRLGAHEYPRIIEFREELPKSPAGKILRRVLREEEIRKLQKT